MGWQGRGEEGFGYVKKSQLMCESVVPCDLSEEDFC
jgi:hypothetical protein